ncbi:MAG: DUF2207 domain-containing protein [Micrococcales bacterium]|nr:DUF2207 domain-containing protein [Micrococcales bacterium]
MRRVTRFVLAGAVGAVCLVGAAPAHSAPAASIDEVDVQAALTSKGVLSVEQTFTLGSSAPPTLSQDIPRHTDTDGMRYSYDVTDISATVDGKNVTPKQSRTAHATRVSVPVAGATTVVVTYQVTGATVATVDDRVSFVWPVLNGLNADVDRVTGVVDVPVGAVFFDCQAGPPGGLLRCSTYCGGTHECRSLTFTHTGLAAGEALEAEVAFPSNVMEVTEQVSKLRTLADSFTLGAAELGALGAIVVAGGVLLFLWWRRARTAGYDGTPVAVASLTSDDGRVRLTVEPTGRPGMIGTIVDSQVDPADILATILDLAQRGFVRITELRTSTYQASDWRFTRLEADESELMTYERLLLDTLTTSEVTVSDLCTSVGESIAAVQDAVYDEVLAAGWYSRLPSARPAAVLWAWGGIAAAVVAAGVLAAWTTFGLAGLGLIAVAVVALAVAAQVPALTSTGAAVCAGLAGLAEQLHTCPVDGVDAGEEYTKISQILPYAVVLGGWDRWLEALVAADPDPDPDSTDLSWYHAPDDWHMQDLPHSLDSFITVVTGRLFTRS